MRIACVAGWFALVCAATALAADTRAEITIDTIAGTGRPENNGDDGPALAVNIGDPFGVEIEPDGALYITEVRNHRVRRLDLKSGALSTVAGSGERGYAGDGGPADQAQMNEPYEVRFDRDGNMFVVEMRNHVVRRVDHATKVISTIAGTGKPGFHGDGLPATGAQFNQPHSIALDRTGAVYIADIGNHRIRRIDPKSGLVETIAGNGQRRLPRDGQPARGNPILGPRALFIDGDTMWIALREGHSVWRMSLDDGVLHPVAGTGDAGFVGDAGPALRAAFNGPKGIAIGPDRSVYVADTENNAVRRIDLRTGLVSTVVGGPADDDRARSQVAADAVAGFNRPHGICVGADGTIYLGDTLHHRVARIRPQPTSASE